VEEDVMTNQAAVVALAAPAVVTTDLTAIRCDKT
jgi:hypothetical protein